MNKKENLIEVNHLSVTFYNGKDENPAVQDVTFKIKKGEVLGVVGESGSGKSVSAMSIMQLIPYPPGKITGGGDYFQRRELTGKDRGRNDEDSRQSDLCDFPGAYDIL